LTFNILLHATVSAMDYTPNVVSKRCFSLYLSIHGLRKGPGKFLTGVLESPRKVLDFSSERVGTLYIFVEKVYRSKITDNSELQTSDQ